MLVCMAAGFIYKYKCSELAKLTLESVDCLDAFNFQSYLKSARPFLAAADWALHRGISYLRCAKC